MDLNFWLELSQGRFLTALLIFSRIGATLSAMPLLSSHSVPPPVRIGLSATIALILTPLFPPSHAANLPLFGAAIAKEVLVGLALGWVAQVLFSCVQMAGEWLDLQSGFQAAQLFNPMFQTSGGPLGHLKYTLAGLVFLVSGSHGIVLTAAAESFRLNAPGVLTIGMGNESDWFGFLTRALWMAIRIAAPVGVTLFLSEMAIAIANRAMPQLNVLMLSLPVKAVLAVAALGALVPTLNQSLTGIFSQFGPTLSSALRILGS